MANWNKGAKNGMWRGGKTLASNGYVLVRVGIDHPMADVRGYAYEHRIIASEKIGRLLKKNEQVHHINGNKIDNRPENLQVISGMAEHRSLHRKRKDLRPFGENNPLRQCECGCGKWFTAYDSINRPRRYISGHNPQDRSTQDAVLTVLKDGELSTREISVRSHKEIRTIKATLTRLHQQHEIVHVRHGVWRINNGS